MPYGYVMPCIRPGAPSSVTRTGALIAYTGVGFCVAVLFQWAMREAFSCETAMVGFLRFSLSYPNQSAGATGIRDGFSTLYENSQMAVWQQGL